MSLIFNNSFSSLIHTYTLNLASWFYFLHLSLTNQTSNNIKLLARNRLHTNKSFQAPSPGPAISTSSACSNKTASLCPTALESPEIPHFHFWERKSSDPQIKENFSNDRKRGKPRQTSPCHSCQAHKEKKSYHSTWLGEFNPKQC